MQSLLLLTARKGFPQQVWQKAYLLLYNRHTFSLEQTQFSNSLPNDKKYVSSKVCVAFST